FTLILSVYKYTISVESVLYEILRASPHGGFAMSDQPIEMQIDREDVILLLLDANERLLGKKTIGGITRLQKLLFLLEKETNFEGIVEFFPFEPYNFGPLSKKVAQVAELLQGCD